MSILAFSHGQSGIMMQLKLVKSQGEDDHQQQDDENTELHGTTVLYELVRKWAHTGACLT